LPKQQQDCEIQGTELGQGRAIVHHQNVWHGSGPNLSLTKDRRALVGHYIRGDVEFENVKGGKFVSSSFVVFYQHKYTSTSNLFHLANQSIHPSISTYKKMHRGVPHRIFMANTNAMDPQRWMRTFSPLCMPPQKVVRNEPHGWMSMYRFHSRAASYFDCII
jgi:hypothetical protein